MLKFDWAIALYFAVTFSALTLVWIAGTCMIETITGERRDDRERRE